MTVACFVMCTHSNFSRFVFICVVYYLRVSVIFMTFFLWSEPWIYLLLCLAQLLNTIFSWKPLHTWIRQKPKLLWLLVRLGKLVEKILLLGVLEQQRRHTFGCSGKQEKYPHSRD